MTKSLLLVGVGGQGTILVTKILTEGLMEEGYDVKMSEIHGMSQRGGSVTTQVRFGEKVFSPSIGVGEADVLVSFEKLEAARYLESLKADGKLIVNTEEIYPISVLSGAAQYPDNIMDEINKKVKNVIAVNASEMAEKVGMRRSANIVLLGVTVKALGLEGINWEEKIKHYLPEASHEVNIKAFKEGLNV
ncbi:MAG: indolepyruvate oxidoreductase subunit beta [Tissierellia bacterium]|nr:indolepyruvate oxidoreductase subunit beta [Tissierellia bacterium]